MAPRKYTLNEDSFSSISTPEKAYWLGFLTADGCVRENLSTVTLHLKAEDASHLDKLQEALESNYPVKTALRDNSAYASLTVCSKKLVRDLVRLGVHSNKTNNVCPWDEPSELVADYWRGVFDGDGCLTQQRRRGQNQWHLHFVSGSLELAKAFHAVACECSGSRGKLYERNSVFEVAIGGNRKVARFVAFIYRNASVALDRKQRLAEQVLKLRTRNDFAGMSVGALKNLFARFGSWTAVARELGTSRSQVAFLRQRLGLA